MSVTFDTRPFRNSHLREPRGYGCWAFTTQLAGPREEVVFAPPSTYADAKKWMQALMIAKYGRGAFHVVYVMP